MSETPNDPAPGSPGSQGADLFDFGLLQRYAGLVLRAPVRHKLVAGVSFLTVMAGAVVAIYMLPPRYRVEASVLALRNPLMSALTNPGVNRDWDAPTRAARETVLRRDNLVSLCKQTDFVERYLATRAPAVRARDWLYEALGQERSKERLLRDLVDTLERRLWVTVGSEGTVTVAFEWSNADLAYRMVDAALQSFLEARHVSEISIVGETLSILEVHAARIQRESAEAITRLEERERQLGSPRQSRPAVRRRLVRDEDLVRLGSVLAARQRALADVEEFRRRRLEELQAQMAQYQTQYAPGHPAIASLRQNIEGLNAPSPQIQSLRGEIHDLENEITRRGGTVPQAGIGGLALPPDDLAISDLRSRLADDDPRFEYERSQLQLLVRQYSSLRDRIDAARVELDTARAAFKYRYSVITPPQMPKRPVSINPPRVLLGALLGGLAFAIFAAAMVDLFSGRPVEAWQVEDKLGIVILSELHK